MLRGAVLARYSRPEAAPDGESASPLRTLGGCLMRLLLVAVVLVLVLAGALYLFGRTLL
ncbi:MAG: hypothetical protein WKG00_19250 [Polyangiaceae bacterium]